MTKNPRWPQDAVYYHIHPLGLLGAPGIDDPQAVRNWRAKPARQAARTLRDLLPWVDHLADMGCTGLYLGPVWQSGSHGYDTIDLFAVDDRLGTAEDLRALVDHCHQRGVAVLLDAVFNHTGRDFRQFQDVWTHHENSMFCRWFAGLDFQRPGPGGAPFAWEGWNGHYDLVKLDTSWPWVREHLFAAVDHWIDTWNIDGLRLDAADCLPVEFVQALAAHCRQRRPDFRLMGEMVHGDYRSHVNPTALDAVSNYEAYKSLWSSFNDGNFFELDWTLKRQAAMYADIGLYNFLDNHDVDRIASVLKEPQQLHALYSLLFAIPGTPSLYYGSEAAIQARRLPSSDRPLRPALDASWLASAKDHPAARHVTWLTRLRRSLPALQYGTWRPLFCSHRQLGFARVLEGQTVLVLANSAAEPCTIDLLGIPDWQRRDCPDIRDTLNQAPVWTNVAEKSAHRRDHGGHFFLTLPPCSVQFYLQGLH